MLDTAKRIADFAHKQGIGDAIAVDHLIRDYLALRDQHRGAVSAAAAARAAWQAFTEDRAEEADVDVAFDALDAALGGK